MSKVVKGYIVKSAYGKYLAREKWWVGHITAERSYVFTPDEVREIIVESKDWEFQPVALIPAIREDGEIRITGPIFSITYFE